MNIESKARFVQQAYKLLTLSHMTTKALQTIYQNNLYSLISNIEQSQMSADYERSIINNLSELNTSIADMSSCMIFDNPTGFDKIFKQLNEQCIPAITVFNEVSDAVQGNSSDDNNSMNGKAEA